MKTLFSTQVCIIDDEPREYRRLLCVLNELRIGSILIRGDRIEELPAKPFPNLRLVFLDMHLGTHGGMDHRSVTAQTAAVFARVVSPESAPIVVIIWTKYSDLADSFRTSLYQACPDFCGRLFLVRLDKPQPPARIDVTKLRTDIERELALLAPVSLLWNWDSLVQRAASCVTTELCRLAALQSDVSQSDNESQERAKMLSALNSIVHFLVKAEAGKSLTEEAAASAFLSILAPLHHDKLENLVPEPELPAAALVLNPGPQHSKPKAEVLVALNTMLLTGICSAPSDAFRPGTLYHVENGDDFESATGVSVVRSVREFCQKQLLEPASEAKFSTWAASCRAVLLEVSPSCDFAQGKRPIMRLVAGLLVPRGSINQLKTRKEEGYSALRCLDFIRVPALNAETDWMLVFSSALVFSLAAGRPCPFLNAIARLKEPVLADLRNWLSHQGSRPGYLLVDEKGGT